MNAAAAVVDLAAPGADGPRRRGSGGLRARAAAFAGGSAPLLVVALAVSMHLGSAGKMRSAIRAITSGLPLR